MEVNEYRRPPQTTKTILYFHLCFVLKGEDGQCSFKVNSIAQLAALDCLDKREYSHGTTYDSYVT